MADEPGKPRVLIAQVREPQADRNGRPTVVALVKTEISENEELKAKVKMLELTIVQMRRSKEGS